MLTNLLTWSTWKTPLVNRKDGVYLQLHGEVSKQPKHCRSVMLDPNILQRLTLPRLIDQFRQKRCQKKRKDLTRTFLICLFRFKKNLLSFAVAFSILYNIPKYFEMETKENENTKQLYIESTKLRQDPIYISLYVFWSKLILVRNKW